MMQPMAYRQLALNAAQPYLPVGRFAHGFAKGKLTSDPIFEYVLSEGLLSSARHVLDLGCGQGVLAALIHSCQQASAAGQWPPQWPPAPPTETVTGIELMPNDVGRAEQALGHIASFAQFVQGDIHDTSYPSVDAVVIFDVLHYLPYDAQAVVLNKVKTALGDRGLLLLRIGDQNAGLGFHMSQWTDRVVTWVRGHRMPPTFCRGLDQWESLLREQGFSTTSKPMSEGTLFSNVLITARLDGTSPHE